MKNDLNNELNEAAWLSELDHAELPPFDVSVPPKLEGGSEQVSGWVASGSELAAPHRFANICMSGNGRVGYLHATAPTPTRKGSSVLRLREDNACGMTIDFDPPLEPHESVEILFRTDVRRKIDSFESRYDEVPTEATLKEQNEQHGKDRLPLRSDSKEQCLRVWKNVNGTLEVSAIRSPKLWDTGRTASEGPQMYRLDVLVDNREVPLRYHFHRDRRCKPRCDSGGGMFYAGSLRMKQWKGPPTGPGSGDEGGGDAPAGICATAIAVPTSSASLVASPRSLSPDLFATAHGSVHPDESPIDVGEEHLVFGEPAEQLVGLPLVDWTLTPEQVRVMSLL